MADQEKAAVEMRGISKAFGGVRALREVSFLVRPGEVHALVGENGAGKSTLMKILQGVFQPDAGEIRLGGTSVRFANPLAARAAGIGMVFQEFSLVPTLSVAENICLCEEPVGSIGLIDRRGELLRAAKILADMDVDIDPTAPLWALSTAVWQLTEIAKALSRNARILILDEPTASLAKHEAEALFALIERLKSRGISIVYISHRMDEIYRIADRITILRDGAWVLTSDLGQLSPDAIIEAIAGREVTNALTWHPRSRAGAKALLEVEGLSAGPRVNGVSLVLHEGEILGLAGLMGSGRTELVTALFGMLSIEAGTIRVSGQEIRITSPVDAIGLGIVLIPEDRRVLGLVLEHSVNENLALPLLGRVANKGVLVARKLRKLTRDLIERFGIKVRDAGAPVDRLSGGNQQKVVIAKWLGTEPRILMMDEPTAGVDVGTKAEILSMVRAVAEEGKGVIFISSELPELLAVSDRILILSKGEVVGDLARADIPSEDVLQLAIQGKLPEQLGTRA
jgi:ribose transport system ATP-binding protein